MYGAAERIHWTKARVVAVRAEGGALGCVGIGWLRWLAGRVPGRRSIIASALPAGRIAPSVPTLPFVVWREVAGRRHV